MLNLSGIRTKSLKTATFLTFDNIPKIYISFGFETWSLTLREERRLRVFENMVLRRIFGLRETR
jgi:hypothetical protein